MPGQPLAEAVGEIRLSDRRLAADLAAAKRTLMQQVSAMERDAAIPLSVTIDQASVQQALKSVSALSAKNKIVVGVQIDAADAQADLNEFQGVVDNLKPVDIPVGLDDTQVRDQVEGLGDKIAPAMDNVGRAAGKSFGSGFGSSFRSALEPLALAATGFLAGSLVKGFQRLTTIQDATASLTVALGDATAAADVLDDVLGVVRGTPFNLDQFAKAASSLISFGVEAEKVPTYLTAIGEASATQGSRANEFAQRLADVFGQVSAVGRLNGEDIWSFAGVGVNALAILGNSLDKTTVEIRDMISEGAIPADAALSILSEGILNGTDGINGATNAFAGTMEMLRETLTGAIGGFSAATARFGAAIIKPLEGILTAGFTAATGVIDNFASTVTNSLGGLAESDGVENFIDFLEEVPDKVGPFIDDLKELGPAIAPIGAAIASLGLGGLGQILPAGLGTPLLGFGSALGVVGTALTALVATTPELREALLPVLEDIGTAIGGVGDELSGSIADAVDASIPLFEKLIGVLAELVPLIGVVGELGSALATVLVPAVGALAIAADAIPVEVFATLLTVFIGYKAIQGVSGMLDSLGTSLGKLGASGEKLKGNAFGALNGQFLQTAESSTKTERAVTRSATAIGGALSGMALQAEDATTQIAGALGAVGSIATGFATGGPYGAAFAAAGIGVGLVVGALQNSAIQAQQVAQRVDEMSVALETNTQKLLENALAQEGNIEAGGRLKTSFELLGEAVLETGEDGDKIRESLNTIGLSSSGLAGAENTIRVLQQIGAFGDPNGDVSKVPEVMDALNAAFGENGQAVADIISKYDDLDDIEMAMFNELGIDFDELDPKIQATIKSIEELQDQSEKTDLTNLITQTLQVAAANDTRNEAALKLAEDETGISRFTKDAADAEALHLETVRLLQEETIRLDELTAGAKLRDLDFTEQQIRYVAELASATGKPISQVINLETGEFLTDLDEIEDAAADLEIPEPTGIEALELAWKDVDEAIQGVNTELGIMQGLIDKASSLQDFDQGFRDIESFFGGIINQDAVDAAEDMRQKIEDQRDEIADLTRDVADARTDAQIEVLSLSEQLQRAEAAGATQGAAALRLEIDRVNQEAEDKQAELNASIAELSAYEAELERIAAAPIAAMTELKNQAAFLGVSMFDLLNTAPTAESQEAFDLIVEGQIGSAIDQVSATLERDGPEAAATLAENLRTELLAKLTDSGLDQATSQALIDSFFDPTAVIATADTAAIAEGVAARLQEDIDAEEAAKVDVEANTQPFLEAMGIIVSEPYSAYVNLELSAEDQEKANLRRKINSAFGNIGDAFNFFDQADGGIVEYFKRGGIRPERHLADIHPAGSWRVFGEPETGGEGYIPLSPFKRERSTQVLTSIADIFGLNVYPKSMELPVRLEPSQARTGAGISEEAMTRAVATGVERANGNKLRQRQQAAERASRSVHVDKIEVSGAKSPTKTATTLIRRLSDLAFGLDDDEDW